MQDCKNHSGAFDRIFSALITPMSEDESLNEQALRQLVRLQLTEGGEGFYCCGSSGEGLLLSLDERKRVLEIVLDEAAGKVPVISHIGTIRTRDVVELAKHAEGAGAAAVSMIPPYYYKFTADEIRAYYEEVIASVPQLGVIIYNIPQFTGVEFSKSNAHELLSNPGIIGIKHTSNNLYSMERMHTEYPDKVIFNGFDEQFLGALSMGASATIGTTVNLFAPQFCKLRDRFYSGDLTGAYALQTQINYRVEVMCRYGVFNAVKYMESLRGIDCGRCRAPFGELSEEAKKALRELEQTPFV